MNADMFTTTTLEAPAFCIERPHDFHATTDVTDARVLLYCRFCGEVRRAFPTLRANTDVQEDE